MEPPIVRSLGIVPIMDIIGDENLRKYSAVKDGKLVATFETYEELQNFKKTLPKQEVGVNKQKYVFWLPVIER